MTTEQPQSADSDETRHVVLPGSLPAGCEFAAQQILSRYGWTFVTEAELGRRIARRLVITEEPAPLMVVAHACAAELLYHACRAVDEPQRIEQGYAELYHYLDRIARRRWPERGSDIVQHAIELIFQQVERCRAPSSFLAFARYKLLHAAKADQGTRAPAISLEDAAVSAQLAAGADVVAEVIGMAELEELVLAIQRLPDPRQRTVVLSKYFLQQSDHTIATGLGITPQYVAVLRGRALRRLREDLRLRRFFLHTDPSEH
jgi:RNA polymerase sigma factor (sigma-70 family)